MRYFKKRQLEHWKDTYAVQLEFDSRREVLEIIGLRDDMDTVTQEALRIINESRTLSGRKEKVCENYTYGHNYIQYSSMYKNAVQLVKQYKSTT